MQDKDKFLQLLSAASFHGDLNMVRSIVSPACNAHASRKYHCGPCKLLFEVIMGDRFDVAGLLMSAGMRLRPHRVLRSMQHVVSRG